MRDLIPDFNTYLFYKKEKKNIKTRSLFSGVGFGYRENIRMDNKKSAGKARSFRRFHLPFPTPVVL